MWVQKKNGKFKVVEVGKSVSGKWWGLHTHPTMRFRQWRGIRAYPWDTDLTQTILLHRIMRCWTCLGPRNMISGGHGYSSKGLMGCWLRTYLFTWTTGGLSGLQRHYVGKPLEVGVWHVPGWVFNTLPERSNLYHRLQGHGLVLLSISKDVCMVWSFSRYGIRHGGW